MSWLNDAEVKTATEQEVERIEVLEQQIRSKRDTLLKETDYLVMPDYPNKPAGVEAYRQALRDVTAQSTFPEAVEWPVKPHV